VATAGRRRALIVKLGAAALAGLAVCSPAYPQDDSRQQTIRSLQDEIRSTEANSPDLIKPLTALGLLYRESGESALALAALGEAVHVVRFNFGLYSLEQAPLVRQLITNAEALGDHWSAWELEKGLLRLARRYPDDPRTAQILRDTGDRRMDMLAKYDAGEAPPEVIYGCYYAGPHAGHDIRGPVPERECMSGSAGAVRAGFALEAEGYYAYAINILRNESYSSGELPRLVRDVVAISYEYGDPSIGRKSLAYLLEYQESNSAPLGDRIDTLMQIADWDLLHARSLDGKDAALAEYAQAYELVQRAGVEQESIREMFAPATPIPLPVSATNPLLAEVQGEDAGHVDAAFDIDKYGKSRRVRILEAKPTLTRAAEKHVEYVILQSRFRPRLVDGRIADGDRVVVRYRLDD
jgi:hypothetical protein